MLTPPPLLGGGVGGGGGAPPPPPTPPPQRGEGGEASDRPHQSNPRNPGVSDNGRAARSFARSGTGRAVRASPCNSASSAAATDSTKASPPRGPTICKPNGIPLRSTPT